MLPGFKAFRITRGDTFAFDMTLQQAGSPYEITQDTVFSGSLVEKGKSSVTSEFSFEVLDFVEGIVRCTLSSAESGKLTGGKTYNYDIQMDNNGVVSTIIQGPIIVKPDYTP
jgi:hypothetical protein